MKDLYNDRVVFFLKVEKIKDMTFQL
uniref:Uncharacterized protein n=1 Tax=Anguilla anguilla TaxID=7936 RepID=A0A0E9T109_ANGAN